MDKTNKTQNSSLVLGAVAAIAGLAIVGGAMYAFRNKDGGVMVGGAMMTPDKTIVGNASNASNVTTLVSAVKAADLVDTLNGTGPFTVFGPTNDAFNKLPAGTVEDLLKPENKETLKSILTYHVVSGKYKSSDLKDGQMLKTVNGEELKISKMDGKIKINDMAMIETSDVVSTNGVTHVIDTVLMPTNLSMKEEGVMVGGQMMLPSLDIVDNAAKASNVTTLVAAVQAGGLVNTLKGEGPFTVFGPTNAAFNKLPSGTVESLLKPENKDQLVSILTYHVVPGKYKISDLTDGQMLTTVNGQKLSITKSNGKVMVNGSTMIETQDVISKNGVTHVIDSVLMPKEGVMVGGELMVPTQDIVENAVRAANVTTVVAAVQAAGLVDTLKSAGPFTVFAPTNDAFKKLPAGTVDNLLKPENKETLKGILTYHVVAGRYKISDLKDGQVLKTVNGKELKISKKDGKVMINGTSTIETKDVISKNGVTHVIDTVLMP
jgi:transforming growth factor-beta-induced protein